MTLLCVMVFTTSLTAQFCPPRTELGSTIDVWDWQQEKFDVYLEDFGYREITSPFYTVPGIIQPNTAYISLVNGPVDYAPVNGWELLYRSFGDLNADPNRPPTTVHTASFSLYNRYTGMVRVFFYIINDNDVFNVASVASNHSNDPFTQGSALYSFTGDVTPPLEDYTPSVGDGFSQFNILQRASVWTVLVVSQQDKT
jgi:hypothetical protein